MVSPQILPRSFFPRSSASFFFLLKPRFMRLSQSLYSTPLVSSRHLNSEHTHTSNPSWKSSNAERFGLRAPFIGNLQARLPTVKFVFPLMCGVWSTVLKEIPIHQWYDNYPLSIPMYNRPVAASETSELEPGFELLKRQWIVKEETIQKSSLWG